MNQSHAQSAKLSEQMPAALVSGLYVVFQERRSVLSKWGILRGVRTAKGPRLGIFKYGKIGES